MTSLPSAWFPWPHHVPHHLCVNIKSSVSAKPVAEWLVLGLPARKGVQFWIQASSSSVAATHTHTCIHAYIHKDPLQSFPGFFFSVLQAWCLQFPRPLLKNDTFSDQMLQTGPTKLWFLAGPSFFGRGQTIYNQRWKLKYPSCPTPALQRLSDIAGFQPRQGLSGGTDPI